MNCQRKTYEVGGMMEWHPVFRVGRASIRVPFTGGHLCGGACSPASYETADAVVQKVIESSDAFRSGRIRLARSIEVPVAEPSHPSAPAQPAAAAPPATPASASYVFEYKDLDDISDFLQEKGVALENLVTMEDFHREAERLGVALKKKS